jgi:hypothetical protein
VYLFLAVDRTVASLTATGDANKVGKEEWMNVKELKGISKDEDSSSKKNSIVSIAAKVALAQSDIVNDTKRFMEKEGFYLMDAENNKFFFFLVSLSFDFII